MKISSSFSKDIGKEVQEASREIGKFSSILKGAVNVDTGKLDLSELNKGLR